MTKTNMTFDTIAFSKGFLRTLNYNANSEINFEEIALAMNPKIISIQAELMRYGYMLNVDCVKYLLTLSDAEFSLLAESVKDYLVNLTGDGIFTSLFGNFPATVLSMTEEEMFIHQIIHYLSGGEYSPNMNHCDDQELKLLNDRYFNCIKDNYHLIKPINDKEFAAYLKELMSSSQSLTSYDKDVVAYTAENWDILDVDYTDVFPEEIPFKETLCIVMANNSVFSPKTITDVLRYAVYLSNGDISLPNLPTMSTTGWSRYSYNSSFYDKFLEKQRNTFKFKKFNRAERRDILSKIESVFINAVKNDKHAETRFDNIYADMKKYLGRWIRLGEILHPGEYSRKYPNTADAFAMIRNAGQYITTFGGRVNAAKDSNDVNSIIKIYSERPGEYARNVDQLLRNYPSQKELILIGFVKILPSVSIKMLYELLEHFNIRNDEVFRTNRYVIPKGARSAFKIPDLNVLDEYSLESLMTLIKSELVKRFNDMESLIGKKFFIEDTVSNVILPSQMRTMNVGKGQLPRGSKLPIKCDTGILRSYVRWVDHDGIYDLDLSATMFDDNFKELQTISWNTNYRTKDNWALFSGDVRHRKGNCAEYIDIKIANAIKHGVRYLVLSVCDYDGEGFIVKDAWGGVMERDKMEGAGCTTWAPDTITTGFKLTSANTNIVMTVIDLQDMYMYVVDEDFAGIPVASCSNSKLATITKRYVNAKHYFNVKSLIELNVTSRGGEVEFISTDKLQELQNTVNENKKELLELRKTFEALIDTAKKRANSKLDTLRLKLESIDKELATIDKTEILTYDDITSDYTKIFKWMF